ncbi:putative EMP1-like protein, partial [Plasmodium gaboni]
KYKAFINDWKTDNKKESQKYSDDKSKQKYTSHPVAISKDAREYLNETLTKMCKSNSSGCNCMNEKSSQNTSQNSGDMPKSLEEEPDIVKGKCDCANKVGPQIPVPGQTSTQIHSQGQDQNQPAAAQNNQHTGGSALQPGQKVDPSSASQTDPSAPRHEGPSGTSPGSSSTSPTTTKEPQKN